MTTTKAKPLAGGGEGPKTGATAYATMHCGDYRPCAGKSISGDEVRA